MIRYRFITADVFTTRVFGGNQLAVFPEALGIGDESMQAIAREFNLSETVFVFPPDAETSTRRVRIFTPGMELPFAGHPTIGTASILAALEEISLPGGCGDVILEEGVGPVRVRVDSREDPIFAELTAAKQPEFGPTPPTNSELAELLSLSPGEIGQGDYQVKAASCGVPFIIVPLCSLEAVSRAKLRRDIWERKVAQFWAPHLFIFCSECVNPKANFHARMFAPAMGIEEDPATGAAATAFGGYLARLQQGGVGEWSWLIEQGLEMGRASEIYLRVSRDAAEQLTICVGGYTVIVSEGDFYLKR